jgi:fluoride exporter
MKLSLLTWIAVVFLGGFAAIARFLVDGFVGSAFGRSFPLGTLVVNLSGAFALGLVSGFALTGNALILIGTATIGSYTTFSTWMLETDRLREEGEFLSAFANVAVSLLVGLGAVALGRTIGAHI